MLLVDDVYTLIDVIIIELIRVDLVSWVVFFCGVVTKIMN